ncbi:hypothetical protein T492DRAFT_1140775 [Pavlovales sp. CCMP2436]|nr:hypothetical protein T492DRAFT_1140775 [Pavlovales sp. CCMP2436]
MACRHAGSEFVRATPLSEPRNTTAHHMGDANDSANLRFGDDFDNAQMLLNTEVAIILKQMIDQRRDSGLIPGDHLRNMLDHIVNLGCDDVDEAKTLIPSLKNKIDHGGVDSLLDNDRLHSILDTVASQRTFDDGAAT